MDNRAKIKKENPDLTMCQVCSKNAEEWQKVSDAKKKKYEKLVEKDRQRYDKEMKEFNEHGFYHNSDGVKSTFLNKKHEVQEFE